VLVGARNLNRGERAGLDAAGIVRVGPARVRREGAASALAGPLAALRRRVGAVYLHVDLDALDPSEGRANPLATPGGLSLDELEAAIRAVGDRFAVRAVAMTAYDPDGDAEGRVARAGLRLLTAIAGAATGAPAPA
jgi:arginase